MARPRITVDLQKLELLASIRRAPREIADALGISLKEFNARRQGRGVDAEFRQRYYAGRQLSREESMSRVDIVLRAVESEVVRTFIAAVVGQKLAETRDRQLQVP